MTCPKCKSENVTVQAVATTRTKHHGIIWWVFAGWWMWIVWLLAFVPMALIHLIAGKPVASETHTEAVCQNCGYRWTV
jgi:uncharacterized membrane protein YccF (DUF307 family)